MMLQPVQRAPSAASQSPIPFATLAVAVEAGGGGPCGGEDGKLAPLLVPRKALLPLHCSLDPIMLQHHTNNHQQK